MPTYEYLCTKCSHHFEVKQSFKDEPISYCPQCQGEARRVINLVSMFFKGAPAPPWTSHENKKRW